MARRCPREGTRVHYDPNPASHALYSPQYRARRGDHGRVTSISLGRRSATCMPGPGGGLVYVRWSDGRVFGVAPQDLRRAPGDAFDGLSRKRRRRKRRRR